MTFTGFIGAACMFPLRLIINASVALGIHPNVLTLDKPTSKLAQAPVALARRSVRIWLTGAGLPAKSDEPVACEGDGTYRAGEP